MVLKFRKSQIKLVFNNCLNFTAILELLKGCVTVKKYTTTFSFQTKKYLIFFLTIKAYENL